MNYYLALESIKRHAVLRNGETCGITYNPESKQAVCVGDSCCFEWWSTVYADEAEMLYYYDCHRAVKMPEVARIASHSEIASFESDTARHRNYGIDSTGQPFAYDTEPLPAL